MILLAVALIGWLTFVVACVGGPVWSPDGSKILFGYYDEGNSRMVVAMYDRSKHKTKDLFVRLTPKDTENEIITIAPTWQADGSRALIGVTTDVDGGDDGECTLISIPINSGAPLQAYNFGKKAVCWTAAMLPQFGDTVYLSGENGLTWLNLSTGEVESKNIPDFEGFIAEHNGELVYVRGTSRPKPAADNPAPVADRSAPAPDNPADTSEKKKETEDGIELGRINLKDASLLPFFSLWNGDPDFDKLKDVFGGSWEPGGTRIAIVAAGEDSDSVVLLDEKKGVIDRFVPNLGVAKFHLGPLVWSHDAKTFYAPVIMPTDKEKRSRYALAEFSTSGTEGRLTPIAEFDQGSMDKGEIPGTLMLGLQVSLSPDGKSIAATTATFDKGVDQRDRGLFLIDVAHPEHRITRILPPKHDKGH